MKRLARGLVHYSCRVQENERVLIHYTGQEPRELVMEVVREVYEAKGLPFVRSTDNALLREVLLGCQEDQLKLMAEVDCLEMSNMDCYIGIRGGENVSELSDVPPEKMMAYERLYTSPVHHDIRVPDTKWVVLRYPNAAMAQLSGASTRAFRDFYYKVCTLDYSRMKQAMEPLIALMGRTDAVRVTGPGTDLRFSIKGIPAVGCAGEMNIPDGEVFTAPARESVNGEIRFNAPSLYRGYTFEQIRLVFENGKIIHATSNDTAQLNSVLDTDEGARYAGEFAIGVNPYILKPMKDILFDEKIMGSIHFTPGNCYEEAPNGNVSAIHWDLVLIQRPEYGGGEIYFDDVLVRKDGRFVLPELECLNPENLA